MRVMLIAALLPLAACGNFDIDSDDDGGKGVPATGSGDARTYAVADFSGVELRGPDDVDVTVGPAFSVRAQGDEAQLGRLKIERVGDTLRIGRIKTAGISWSRGEGVKVHVTMPRIAAGSIAGSGNLAIDRVEAETFKGSIAGSGDLTLGAVTTRTLRLSIAGSGDITAAGITGAARIEIAGSGGVDGAKLAASSADISIAGSGDASARVDGPAKIAILGSGDVTLSGKPQCQTSKMGSGTVRCGD